MVAWPPNIGVNMSTYALKQVHFSVYKAAVV